MTFFRRFPPSGLASFLGLALALGASPSPTRADARTDAFQAFQAGSAGDSGAAARAAQLYRSLAAAEPGDPVLLAYAGAAETLTGRDASSPLDAMNVTEGGLARVDRALKLLGPESDQPGPSGLPRRLETWLVAATTYLSVPDEIFHRLGDGKTVLARLLAHPALPHLPPGLRAQLARLEARAAKAERRPQDELAALRRASALDPSGPTAGATQARIAELAR